jgi:hypothetical protein
MVTPNIARAKAGENSWVNEKAGIEQFKVAVVNQNQDIQKVRDNFDSGLGLFFNQHHNETPKMLIERPVVLMQIATIMRDTLTKSMEKIKTDRDNIIDKMSKITNQNITFKNVVDDNNELLEELEQLYDYWQYIASNRNIPGMMHPILSRYNKMSIGTQWEELKAEFEKLKRANTTALNIKVNS